MIELMDKFPRRELLHAPSRPVNTGVGVTQERTNMPGSGKSELIRQFQGIWFDEQLNRGRAIDEMLQAWIETHRTLA